MDVHYIMYSMCRMNRPIVYINNAQHYKNYLACATIVWVCGVVDCM